jgi:hypothetical protein
MKNYQVLMFDVCHGRTCLHYAAYYGHSSCLKAILSAAQSSPVAASWLVLFGFVINFFPNWFISVMYFDDFKTFNNGKNTIILQGVCTVCEY